MKFAGPLLLLILFFGSCKGIKAPVFVDVEHLRVHKFGLKNSSLKMDLKFNNPNHFGMKLTHAEGDAWIDDNFLGHFIVDTLVQISPKEDFLLPVKLELDMGKVLKNSMLAILTPDVTLKIEGNARIGKGIVFINYPFHYSGKHNLTKLLSDDNGK